MTVFEIWSGILGVHRNFNVLALNSTKSLPHASISAQVFLVETMNLQGSTVRRVVECVDETDTCIRTESQLKDIVSSPRINFQYDDPFGKTVHPDSYSKDSPDF